MHTTAERMYLVAETSLPPLLVLCFMHAYLQSAVYNMIGSWTVDNGSGSANWIAHNLVVIAFDVATVFIAVLSTCDGSVSALGETPRTRLYGHSTQFDMLCRLTVAFETYNTFVTAVIFRDEHIFTVHHICTLFLAFAATVPYAHYYGLFFFGLANVSSALLATFTLFDALRMKYPLFDTPYRVSRTAFGIVFLVVRCDVWLVLSVFFWLDNVEALRGDWSHSAPVTVVVLGANLFLTSLQFFWGSKVVSGIRKHFNATDTHGRNQLSKQL